MVIYGNEKIKISHPESAEKTLRYLKPVQPRAAPYYFRIGNSEAIAFQCPNSSKIAGTNT